MKHAFALLVGALVALPSAAQYDVKLAAATAIENGKPEVRLRWQFREGWFPPGGLRLYHTNNNSGRLLKFIPPPSEQSLESHFTTNLAVRKVVALARTNLPPGTKLNFTPTRPPSARSDFIARQAAVQQLKRQMNPTTSGSRFRTVQTPEAASSTVRRQVGTPLPSSSLRPPLSPDKLALSARAQLHFAAFLQNTNSALLGLGATDANVALGQTISYALYAVDGNGQTATRPLAQLTGFVVGADPQPPAPSNILVVQEEDEVSLRWDRLPVDREAALLAASYRVTRSAGQATSLLTPKPVVILNLETDAGTNAEPESFFSDTIQKPDTYTYRITLVDGFDRNSDPGVLTFAASDWRRPPKPIMARASLGSDFLTATKGAAFGRIQSLTKGKAQLKPRPPIRPTLAWRFSTNGAEMLPVQFNIYRLDLDETNPPVKITATPIDGTLFRVASDAQWEQAKDLLLGTDADELNELRTQNKIERMIEQGQLNTNDARQVAIAWAREKAKSEAILNHLREGLQSGKPPMYIYEDKTAQRDRWYSYFITALYAANGLETDPVDAGSIGVPDFTPPPAVTGLVVKNVTIKPPTNSTYLPLATNKKLSGFRAGEIQKRLTERNLASAPSSPSPSVNRSTPNLRGITPSVNESLLAVRTNLPARFPIKLNIPEQDYGATVELAWNPVPNMRGVVYQVRRSYMGETNELGLTATNVVAFKDKVPRSRMRDYQYQVIALSRWGIFGATATRTVTVESSVKPEPPNLLSATPADADGEILLSIEPASTNESVTSYAVFRDGILIGSVSNSPSSLINFVDKGRKPGEVGAYKVKARTRSDQSDFSQELKGAAVKTKAAAPTDLAGVRDPKGVKLKWSPAPGSVAASYIVRRKQTSARGTGPSIVLAHKETGTTFIDVFAMSGRTYTYEVLAVDVVGNVSPATVTTVNLD